MEKWKDLITFAAFLIFGGLVIAWEMHGNYKFSEKVRNFIANDVVNVEICNRIAYKALNCKPVLDNANFTEIISSLANNLPNSCSGSHPTVHQERVVKLYSKDAMLCFTTIASPEFEGEVCLYPATTDNNCSTFSTEPHTASARGLDKYLMELGR